MEGVDLALDVDPLMKMDRRASPESAKPGKLAKSLPDLPLGG